MLTVEVLLEDKSLGVICFVRRRFIVSSSPREQALVVVLIDIELPEELEVVFVELGLTKVRTRLVLNTKQSKCKIVSGKVQLNKKT